MRYISEFRDLEKVRGYLAAFEKTVTRKWTLMEVCGGQTHAILRYGIDEILSPYVELLHGPGCPVCVTPAELIDVACRISLLPGSVLCSFGDMVRVPGSQASLLATKAEGGEVQIVYSPLDALAMAERNPQKRVVFFAVGFETTAPANAMAVFQAQKRGMGNFSILSAQVLVPAALRAILSSGDCRVNGFLAAGHVCAVTGYEDYESICSEYGVPIVVTGFEPIDLLSGIYSCIRQLEQKQFKIENRYSRVVRREGNHEARRMMETVFQVIDRNWRGIGVIPKSGLGLRSEFSDFDALQALGLQGSLQVFQTECHSGQVLQGLIRPDACPAFGTRCTPETPLGATMVSSEGACAAYYRYRPLRQMAGKLPTPLTEQF